MRSGRAQPQASFFKYCGDQGRTQSSGTDRGCPCRKKETSPAAETTLYQGRAGALYETGLFRDERWTYRILKNEKTVAQAEVKLEATVFSFQFLIPIIIGGLNLKERQNEDYPYNKELNSPRPQYQ